MSGVRDELSLPDDASAPDDASEEPALVVVTTPRGPLATFLMQVIWPAFLGAVVSVGVLFSLLDPLAVDLLHGRVGDSREATYTIAFVVLWALHGFACALTWLLASTGRRGRFPV